MTVGFLIGSSGKELRRRTDAEGEKLLITYETLDRELPRALSPWAMVRAAAQWRAPLERE